MPPLIASLWASIKAAQALLFALAFAVLLALLVVQTVRIDGFRFLFLHHKGLSERVAECEAAKKAAQEAYAAQEQRQGTIATDYEREADNAAQVATIREREIRTIFRDVPVAVECAAPDAARRVLAEAVTSANAATGAEPSRAVPDATAAP